MSPRPRFAQLFTLLLLLCCVRASAQQKRPELVLQTGHSAGISEVAFSLNGRFVATAGDDNAIRLWEVSTGRELSVIRDFSYTHALAFDPEGQAFMAEGNDLLKVWDVLTGAELRSFDVSHPGAKSGIILGSTFSADRKVYASAGHDMTIRFWDTGTGKLMRVIRTPPMKAWALAISPDGQIIAGSDNKTLRFWNLRTGLPVGVRVATAARPIAFSPAGKIIAGTWTDGLKLWDVKTGGLLRTMSTPKGNAWAVVFSPDGRLIVWGGSEAVEVWDVASGKLLRKLAGAGSLAFSPDGKLLAATSKGSVRLLDTTDWAEVRALRGRTSVPGAVTFSPDGKMIAHTASAAQKSIKLWSVGSGRELSTLKIGERMLYNSVAFSPDSRLIVSGDLSGRLWETATGREVLTWGEEFNKKNLLDFKSFTFSPGGQYVVTGSTGGELVFWETATGKPVGVGKTGAYLSEMALSPDGTLIATASFTDNNAVAIWKVSPWQKLFDLGGHTKTVWSVAFAPDSKTLASGSDDGVIKLWDAGAGTEMRTLKGHEGTVFSVVFSPDGKTLASAGRDKSIRLWEVATGREIRMLTGSTGYIQSLAYSPEGKVLASSDLGGGVKLWNTATGRELATLITLDESDWLVVTPDGLFDGSPGAWGLVLWRFGQSTADVLPAEAFFNEFYYPGLLSDLIAGQRPKAARDISEKDRRQPTLALSADASPPGAPVTSREIKLQIQVMKAEAGAHDVRLFRNGSLVRVWRGDVLAGKQAVTLEATVPLIAGRNRFMAYAFNRDNVKSADATLTINGSDSLRRLGTAYVLAVGVNAYANSGFDLKFAVADARAFAAEWKRRNEGLRNYERVEVIALEDGGATKMKIIGALATLSKQLQPEDALVFYFAGHGIAHESRFYLVPHDLGYAGGRTKLDGRGLESLLSHSVSDRELEESFEKIDAGQLLLVIDACNSGQALEAEEKRRGPMNSKGLAQLAYEKGMYVLTAAQSYQAALEATQLGHGLLTYALVEEGLKAMNADGEPKDGVLVAKEWLDFATARVPQMQLEEMRRAGARGINLSFAEEERGLNIIRRIGQRPRVFYRRELEANPWVIAKSEGRD